HTRFSRDWSSDVCSSDLTLVLATRVGGLKDAVVEGSTGWLVAPGSPADLAGTLGRITRESAAGLAQGIEDFVARNTWDALADDRSEERRVGKEGSAGVAP